jgi:hypothetical protein
MNKTVNLLTNSMSNLKINENREEDCPSFSIACGSQRRTGHRIAAVAAILFQSRRPKGSAAGLPNE